YLDLADSWRTFVDALLGQQRNVCVIAPDCRGHGDSGWVGAGGYYHFPDYIWDLNALIEALKLSAFSLVGHSMGGTISFMYTGTFPERIRKLVLVEGIGPLPAEFSDAPARMERWIAEVRLLPQRKIVEYSTLDVAAERMRRKNPRLNPELAVELARSAMRRLENGSW